VNDRGQPHDRSMQLSLFLAPAIAPLSDEGHRRCGDCLVDVIEIGERYMIHDPIRPIEPEGGVLCVVCLEKRIARRLNARDFTDCLGNRGAWSRSERLCSRMAGIPTAALDEWREAAS
jgi:hypothetical protein